MIAAHAVEGRPRVTHVRTAKNATHKRRSKSVRVRYAGISRICLVLGIGLVAVMGYVMLMSNLTGLNYATAKAEHQRAALQEETMRLDDRLAGLGSQERLAKIASSLGMREPQQFALVSLPAPHLENHTHLALLSSVAGWFNAR